jgi:cytochrome c oxidase cbb3-type subunit 3
MPLKLRATAAALFLLWALAITRAESVQQPPAPAPAPQTPAAQAPPAQAPRGQAPQQPPAGRGRGRGDEPATFPAQQRAPGDPALIERGRGIYSTTCAACHGGDLRGGQLGGPNLLRSLVVLNDQQGELILPIVHGSRAERGMPPLPLPDDDVRAVAEYIHSVVATSGHQGMPPPSEAAPPNIVIGDASAGQAYFAAKCSSCHSPTGDLQGIATRIPEPKNLQLIWVSGGAVGGRGGRGPSPVGAVRKPVTVTVTLPSGEKASGRLVRVDHFLVTMALDDGTIRSFRRNGDQPKVEIQDPNEPHRKLLGVYTEKDIHDLTAYLVTLK